MLRLRVTPRIQDILLEASQCSTLPEALCAEASRLAETQTIPWTKLKDVVGQLSKAKGDNQLSLHELCQGSSLDLQSPVSKEKSPELQARLAKLQDTLDNQRYEEMVADITQPEKKAAEMRNAILPTARLQMSFGAHVLVTMFTFFATAYYGSKIFLDYDELWAGLLGALGLFMGLVLETTLLIIRSNRPVPYEERMPELFDPKIYNKAFEVAKEVDRAKKAGKAAGSGPAPASSSSNGSGTHGRQESKKGR